MAKRSRPVLAELLIDESPDALIALSTEGHVLVWNRGAETIFGFKSQEALGRPLEELVVPEERRAEARETLARTLEQGAALVEIASTLEDGSPIGVEVAMRVVRNAGLQPFVAVVARRQPRNPKEQNERLQESSRLKSEFLANMSHELRTPLNVVIGFASLMHGGKAGALSDVQREYLGDILTSSRHLLELINDALELARLESGRVDLKVETVDLSNLVDEVLEILRGFAAEKRVRMRAEIDPTMSVVTLDPRMAKKVLYNYLSNAVRFTPEDGRVTLRITPEPGETFRIDVEDTGAGVKPEDVSRLFVEFQQLDGSASKNHPGTGLELALTKKIVEAHGGTVAAKSTPGKGSTFSAVLPSRGPAPPPSRIERS